MSATVATLAGKTERLSDETLEELVNQFHGPVLTPDSEEYDDVRVVQNGMIDREPGLIVRCSGPADVIDAVNLARERDLLIAVRGGGHSIAGHGICDGGLMIDLSRMRGVWVDPERRVVRVEAGCTWGDVDRETQVHGLVVPGGVVSTTGVAGLTLGGGIGWTHRKFGLSCDNLRSVEIVTADGELRTASESENPELLWALRGGGGNFGIVTAFEFDAHPLGPIVMNVATMYAAEDADRLLPEWVEWADGQPDEVTTRAIFWSMPEAPILPEAVQGRDVFVVAALYAGDPDEGEHRLAPIRNLGTALADLSGQMPYRVAQSDLDPLFPKGELRNYWKSIYLGDLGDDVQAIVLRRALQRPDPHTLVHMPMLGGAVSRVDSSATAFGDRSAPWMLSVDGGWTDPADDEANIAWVRDFVDRVGELPTSRGTYLNFRGDADIDARDREDAFGANLQRLSKVKREYDPHNRFRMNANIEPA